MIANSKQVLKAQEILKGNPSINWDGIFGFYSNGTVVMDISWNWEKDKLYKINIDRNGNIEI